MEPGPAWEDLFPISPVYSAQKALSVTQSALQCDLKHTDKPLPANRRVPAYPQQLVLASDF